MSGRTLDISSGEIAALGDYSADRTVRGISDYIEPGGRTCLLCGPIGSCAHAASHLHSKAHRARVSSYYTCLQSLYALQAADMAASEDSVSRRETVLAYLGNRISRSIVTGGIGSYNHVAVAYLLRRRDTSALLKAFRDIRGGPEPASKGLCTICMERSSSVMFDTCRHVCACATCAAQLPITDDVSRFKKCPICRTDTTASPVFIV